MDENELKIEQSIRKEEWILEGMFSADSKNHWNTLKIFFQPQRCEIEMIVDGDQTSLTKSQCQGQN